MQILARIIDGAVSEPPGQARSFYNPADKHAYVPAQPSRRLRLDGRHPNRIPMTVKLARIEWYALAAAVVMAGGFFVHQWFFPSNMYDAGQYARMAREIADHGLFTRFTASALRTYGYPVLLSFVYRGAGLVHVPFLVLLFFAQFVLFLAACFFLRNALSRQSPFAGRVAFCGLVANYYSLLYTTECLSESVTLSLLVIVAGLWLEAYRSRQATRVMVVASFLAGFSMVVRPANLFIVVAWMFGACVVGLRRRHGAHRPWLATIAVLAALALPLLPQFAYNGLRFGRWTPLVAQDLGKMQQAWGIRDIKYATGMPPVPEPRIHYVNPFLAGTSLDDESPMQWYVRNPGRGALTLAIHTFNLTDQDLLFTYSRDLDPWYRVPLGLVNHGVVMLGLLGGVLAVRALKAQPGSLPRDSFVVLFVMVGSNWAMHVWTAVEMRFGLALLLVLFPLSVYALIQLHAGLNGRKIAFTTIGLVAYVASALWLSGWVRDQAPLIRAARVSGTGAVVTSPAPVSTSPPDSRSAQ